ncbi:MAG: hypothetical protein QJR03_01210 [Sphaerobacter sp.]|nr:hypothetical protein [Sphaerobacter sp.]
MRYYLKTARGTAAEEIDAATGEAILAKGRHEGRRVVEVFTLHASGRIDRCVERPRRKLGSNAIASRSWLCETYQPDQPEGWGDDRYVHDAAEAVADADPEAVMLVLLGAEGDSEANVAQLQAVQARS